MDVRLHSRTAMSSNQVVLLFVYVRVTYAYSNHALQPLLHMMIFLVFEHAEIAGKTFQWSMQTRT